jgi:hypothetical protein
MFHRFVPHALNRVHDVHSLCEDRVTTFLYPGGILSHYV